MQLAVGIRRKDSARNKSKNLVTIRHATIYEVSHLDISKKDICVNIQNESFEVEFDSAEFDDLNINEGYRPAYNHEFFHNENNIKYLKARRSKTIESRLNIPFFSFY